MNKTILMLTDNPQALALAQELIRRGASIEIRQSPKGSLEGVPRLEIKQEWEACAAVYDLIVSMHCKQLFPSELVRRVRCVNVHPGFNPENRGWFPQVFSIINGLRARMTSYGPTIMTFSQLFCSARLNFKVGFAILIWTLTPFPYALPFYASLVTLDRCSQSPTFPQQSRSFQAPVRIRAVSHAPLLNQSINTARFMSSGLAAYVTQCEDLNHRQGR